MPPEADVEELRDRYLGIVQKSLKEEARWPEILKIGIGNSEGQLIIAGGFIHRRIIRSEYGKKTKREYGIIDVDFVTSQLSTEPYSPRNLRWSERRTRFENPSFWKDQYCVSITSLNSYNRPTIEDFLDTTPLDIQSIGLIINREEPFIGGLIGDKGIRAIHRGEVRINNLREGINRILREWRYEAHNLNIDLAEFERYIKEINLNPLILELVKRKAYELGLKPNLTLPTDPPENYQNLGGMLVNPIN